MNIHSKLEYITVKYKKSYPCSYCFKYFSEGTEFIQVFTRNRKILDFFGKGVTARKRGMWISLCPQCFSKLHNLLEDTENEGWITLEESDYD
jgi:hypothetical protein